MAGDYSAGIARRDDVIEPTMQRPETKPMATIPLRGLHHVSVKQTYFDQEARARIIDYSMEVENLPTADEVLNRLDDIVSENNPIRVQGANRFPTKVGDWRRIQLGKNAFVHRDVPRGWTEEWTAFVKRRHCLGLMTARIYLAPFTSRELTRMLDPVGIDRWPVELKNTECAMGIFVPWVDDGWWRSGRRSVLTTASRSRPPVCSSWLPVQQQFVWSVLVSFAARRIDSRACFDT